MKKIILNRFINQQVHRLRGENIVKYLDDVSMINNSNYEDIIKYQKNRLCEVLAVAASSDMRCYNSLRNHVRNINVSSVNAIINDLPLLSKEELRQCMKESGKPRNITVDYRSTSGSTGIPFAFYKDRFATGYLDAVLYAAYAWHGITASEPQARFWGVPLGCKGGLVSKVKDLIKNRRRFSAFDLSKAAMEDYYNKILKFQPTYFYGYPSLIAEFCRYAEENCKNLKLLKMKAVIGTGEYVYQKERDLVEKITSTRFVNEYGCTEIGIIGFECEYGKMHLMASNVYLEVIKDGKSVVGEEGDIHVTELHCKCLPFIRYGVGDRGIISHDACECKRHLPIITILSGRKDDYILTSDGNIIYDAIFAYVLKKGVNQFKAVQTDYNNIDIYLVANSDYSKSLENKYISTLNSRIGNKLKINIIHVNKINRNTSGKLSYFQRLFN